jgi:hypothetical protein
MIARALEVRCQCCEWYFTMDETQSLVCDECRLSEKDDADDPVANPVLIAADQIIGAACFVLAVIILAFAWWP